MKKESEDEDPVEIDSDDDCYKDIISWAETGTKASIIITYYYSTNDSNDDSEETESYKVKVTLISENEIYRQTNEVMNKKYQYKQKTYVTKNKRLLWWPWCV